MCASNAAARANVALGKPATQSSVSEWASERTPEADASIATNGDIASPRHFHTDREVAPWWQVDLGGSFVIEQLRIFNRRDFSERLRTFTILVSPTAAPGSWLVIGRKTDNTDFGRGDDTPFVLTPGGKTLARFVRIRKDEPGFLHFRECEVIGYAPDVAELALLEQDRQRLTHEQQEAEREHAAGRTGFITRIGSLAIFVDTRAYSAMVAGALRSGTYEDRERSLANTVLQPTDRVLEIGTAIGLIAMTAAATVGPDHVMTYDANPAMVMDARRNFAANRMSGITSAVGVMRNRSRRVAAETTIDFYIARNFWASRLGATADDPEIVGVAQVPLVCLEDKIAEHQANVLFCDIEGGEADLLDGADLRGIRLIMLEIHYWAAGRRRIDDMMRYLVCSGFNIDFDRSGGSIVLFHR